MNISAVPIKLKKLKLFPSLFSLRQIEYNITLKSRIKDLLKNKDLSVEERRRLNRELVQLERNIGKCKRIAKCTKNFMRYDELYEGKIL
jgi:hypothetical protein